MNGACADVPLRNYSVTHSLTHSLTRHDPKCLRPNFSETIRDWLVSMDHSRPHTVGHNGHVRMTSHDPKGSRS